MTWKTRMFQLDRNHQRSTLGEHRRLRQGVGQESLGIYVFAGEGKRMHFTTIQVQFQSCVFPLAGKKNPEVHIFGIGAQHAKDLQDVRMVGFYLTQLWGVFWGSQNIRKITVARRKLVYEVQIYQQGLPSMA